MKKLLSSLLALSCVLGTVCNVKALESNTQIDTRLAVYEATRTYYLPAFNNMGDKVIGYITSKCVAQIKELNGNLSIESYTLSAPREDFSVGVHATATLVSSTKSGLKVTALWHVQTFHPSVIPNYNIKVEYDFGD